MVKYVVHEHMHTWQGEGLHTGRAAYFIRFYGCNQKCPWCLGPETDILIADGKRKKIKDIAIGDVIVGYDEETGTLQETVVTNNVSHDAEELLSVKYAPEGSEARQRTVVCTPEHRFYVKLKGWVRADQLLHGDIILSSEDLDIRKWRMRGDKNPMKVEEVQQRVRLALKGVWTPEKRKEQSERHKAIRDVHRRNKLGDKNPMKRPEVAHKSLTSRSWRVSSGEKQVKSIIDSLGLPFTHNTKMQKRIDGRYPDFYDEESKKVIEVFDPSFKPMGSDKTRQEMGYAEQVTEHYKSSGYECLPLEVYRQTKDEEIGSQITEFSLNGYEVQEVKPLSPKAYSRYGGKPSVYDLTCEPYPTFFANSLLTHNCDSAGTWHKDFIPEFTHVLTAQEVVNLVPKDIAKGTFVVLTGGEPALYNLGPIVRLFHFRDIRVHIETAGHCEIDDSMDWITLSPKPFAKHPLMVNLFKADEFKVIVDSEEALAEGLRILEPVRREKFVTTWLHPEWSKRNDPAILNLITEAVKADATLRAGYQLHKLYLVDQLDPNSKKVRVPLGGNPELGDST